MREITYVLRFERPRKGAPTVAQNTGGLVSYVSDYTLDKDGIRFTENGTVTFGATSEHTLTFSTLGDGYLLPPADPETGMTRGIVMWRIDSGTGFFESATGLIASNFRVNLDTEQLVDDHLYTIWLPDETAA